MGSFDRREVAYTQARNELFRRMDAEFAGDLEDADRSQRVSAIVRELQGRYPDLDEPMTQRLMGEGLNGPPGFRDPI